MSSNPKTTEIILDTRRPKKVSDKVKWLRKIHKRLNKLVANLGK